jgi:hypothetical protein
VQSCLDCSEAAGDVNSIYSTPKSSNALAISIFLAVSKKALANCSPSKRYKKKSSDLSN